MLRPCPLCGNPYIEVKPLEVMGYLIACGCGIEFKMFILDIECFILAWNMRHDEDFE